MNLLQQEELAELEAFKTKEEEKEEWQIKDMGTANWALRKYNVLEEKISETKRIAESERKRIEEWERKQLEAHQQSQEFFTHKLGDYLFQLRKEDKKARIVTPYGSVGTRKQTVKINYGEKSIEELKTLGLDEFIRIKEEVNVAELKKVLKVTPDYKVITPDGEQLKTVIVEPATEKVVVKGV